LKSREIHLLICQALKVLNWDLGAEEVIKSYEILECGPEKASH